MASWSSYDEAVAAIYAAGARTNSLDRALDAITNLFAAASAGISIYDQLQGEILFTLFSPARRLTRANEQQISAIYRDAGARILTRTTLSSPKRFTDIVPWHRLQRSRWFQEQMSLSSLGYGVAMDLTVGETRARLFVLRGASSNDFEEPDLDTLARIARHAEQAFVDSANLLDPAKQDGGGVLFATSIRLPERSRERTDTPSCLAKFGLSAAEVRVVLTVACLRDRSRASQQLGISINTVKTHLRRAYAKLDIATMADLVALVPEAERRGT